VRLSRHLRLEVFKCRREDTRASRTLTSGIGQRPAKRASICRDNGDSDDQVINQRI
jgi:hypothetical protein